MKVLSIVASLYTSVWKNSISDGILSNFNNSERLLWDRLVDSEISREEASDLTHSGKDASTFNKFLKKLNAKAVDIIISARPNYISKTQKDIIDIHKQFFACKILYSFSRYDALYELCKKLIKESTKYSEHLVSYQVYRYLAEHYILREKNVSKANDCRRLAINELENSRYEAEAHFMYADIMKSKNPFDFIDLAKKYTSEMEKNLKPGCHFFMLFYYYVKMFSEGEDKRGMIKVAEEAIDFFSKLQYDHVIAMSVFRTWIARCNIDLQNWTEAEKYLQKNINSLPNGKQKLVAEIALVRMRLFSSQYDLAAKLLSDIHSRSSFKSQTSWHKSDVYTMHLFLYIAGESNLSLKRIKNNLTRHGEHTPKKAIGLICAGVKDKGVDYIIENESEIDHWLRKGISERSKAFLRYLKQVAKKKYANAKPSFDKIEELPSRLQFSKSEEIIPYEEIIQLIGLGQARTQISKKLQK